MAIIPARIQVKRGPLSQLDKSMLLPGEFAVPTDSDCIYICIRAGVVLEIPSRENLAGLLDKISEQSLNMQDILDNFEKLEIVKCNVDDSGVSVLTTYSSSKIEELFENYYTKAEADVRYGPSTLVSDVYSNQKTYVVGDYCIYNNVVYKCITPITTSEEFTVAKWEKTSISKELNQLNKSVEKAITTDNIGSQSVKSATTSVTATSATSATKANYLVDITSKSNMGFSYKANTKPSYLWGNRGDKSVNTIFTPDEVVYVGKGIRSNDSDTYYKIQNMYTFIDSDNVIITGTKGTYIWGITSFSDERVKKNIKESKVDALNLINKIGIKEFDFIDERYGKHKDIGYIAQQLKDVIPECVVFVPQDKEKMGYDGLYQIEDKHIIPYLVRAVQQLYEILKKGGNIE